EVLGARDAAAAGFCGRDLSPARAAEAPAGDEPGRDTSPVAVAGSLKVRVLLSLGYGCGLRAGEVVRLKVKHIDRAQNIIRVEQSKSLPPRRRGVARIATSCCRPRCSLCCGSGGR